MKSSEFLSGKEKKRIKKAIAQAELNTSGEIRLRIEDGCSGDPMERAVVVFNLLHMYKTKERNGILLYLAPNDRKMAIIGDSGINDKIPEGFWESTLNKLKLAFAKGQFADGIVDCIEEIGDRLKQFFPYHKDDVDELDNEISYDNLNE
jgi:uncharacterized membrane protein